MAHKIYIVWCKLNKATPKFDVGIYTNEIRADKVANAKASINTLSKIWVSEYKLSKVYKEKHYTGKV